METCLSVLMHYHVTCYLYLPQLNDLFVKSLGPDIFKKGSCIIHLLKDLNLLLHTWISINKTVYLRMKLENFESLWTKHKMGPTCLKIAFSVKFPFCNYAINKIASPQKFLFLRTFHENIIYTLILKLIKCKWLFK